MDISHNQPQPHQARVLSEAVRPELLMYRLIEITGNIIDKVKVGT